MNKILIFSLVAIGVIAVSGLFFPQVTEVVTERVVERLGSNPGPDFLNRILFHENFGTKGHVATTSTATAFTLTTKELRPEVSFISWTTDRTGVTLTTMASTSAPFSNLAVGEGFSVEFYSATTTAAATITWAAGTGVDLQEDEGETVIINGLETSRLNFRKKVDTDILMWVEMGQVGD